MQLKLLIDIGHTMFTDSVDPLPPPKRVRLENANSNSSFSPMQHPKPTKHDRLWFSDGNFIITTADVAFKLHRGVLSLHSEFFRGMFDAPHTGQGDEMREGCPVVHVTDCGEHLAYFFTLLYDGARE